MTALLALLLVLGQDAPEQAPPPRAVQSVKPDRPDRQKKGKKKKPKADEKTLTPGLLSPRSIGPAVTSGRVVGFAVHPRDRSTFYVAVASGGVWKTTNGGTTWRPVFDDQGSYSIGYVALDPKDPNTVWVGTGENNSQRSVGYGDGVYKSTNGGNSWTNVGLKHSEHIGRILVNPRDSNTVYVAAQGPLWGPGGDRGLYKTTDSGKTWKNVLKFDEHTGVTDVVMPDPAHPDVLLAASWQRARHVWSIVNGGPGSGLHRSTDGGKTWKKVTSGLPGGELGRLGLAVAPSAANTVYAIVETADRSGGIYRSTDGGQSWQKRNPFEGLPMYYAHLVVDPANKDRVYVMDTIVRVSDDGGGTVRPLGARNTHVDYHALYVDPKDPKYYLIGCDGGVYESFDRGANWQFKANLPVTQFYDVGADQNPKSGKFYHVYGGTQDNFTLGGPARTRSAHGIVNGDWYVVQGGDGFHVKVDPADPDTIYAEAQYGGLVRYDRKTGTRIDITPLAAPGEPPLRWNWDSPIVISPHDHRRVYFACNRVFRTDDRGGSWAPVSPDLSRQLDRDKLKVMGKLWGPDAVGRHQSTSFYGNIVALAESLKTEGLLFAGTDDGLIQVTEDGGKSWTKYDEFPGVPDRSYVSKLVPSGHDGNTVYAAFDNHKESDYKPYLLKSTDAGKTWASIAGDLPPRGTVYCVAEDHVDPNLLFCGTEFGLYVTRDGGKKWLRIRDDLPTIQVKDLLIQKHNNDLVVGTFGRGIYVIDDYSHLRSFDPAVLKKDVHLFPASDAVLYAPMAQFGGGGKAFQGAAFFTAANPPFGAAFLFHRKEALKSLKQKREDAEKKAKKEKKEPPIPTLEELRKEAEEEPPTVTLTVTDDEGFVLATVDCPTDEGMHRVTWSLRETGGGVAMPGTYKATLGQRVGGKYSQVAGPVEFKVVTDVLAPLTEAQYAEIAAFNKKARALQRALSATTDTASDLVVRLERMRSALGRAERPAEAAKQQARDLIARVKLIQRALTGDSFLASRNENTPVSIAERVREAARSSRGAIHPPTGTQKQAYSDAREQLATEVGKLRAIQEKELPALEKWMAEVGAPLPPGRLPVIERK
ncbi:MAG TPA: hypothetical protein VFG68_13210 [Fimbriiglobus sp.]|nr:hypothetical protein [Fimbriiglobus sp.]